MEFTKSENPDGDVQAIEDALSRIGEPITEARANAAALEGCGCKEGMFVGGNASAAFRRFVVRRSARNDGDPAAPR
jgi:hypothetical protein